MQNKVLSHQQASILPLLHKFNNEFGLVGGTAIALQLGHRQSIDFDLFTNKEFDNLRLRSVILESNHIDKTIIDSNDELTVIVDGVKLTFYKYPYQLMFTEKFENLIFMPDLLTLSAMKAFALGRRAKWKDYVDMYFLIQKLGFASVVKKSEDMFRQEFNQKLFRSQLSYFEDIDFTEEVIYLSDNPPSQKEIESYLIAQAIG